MEITEVRVWIPEEQRGKILASASVTFDGVLVVRDFKILEGEDGLWVGFPSRKAPEGARRPYIDIAFSLDKEFREKLQARVLAQYEAQGGAQGPSEGQPPEEA